MTWIHCHIKTGDIIDCTDDEHFGPDHASEDMQKRFVNVYTTRTREEMKPYTIAEVAEDGTVIRKHTYNIDLNTIVAEKDRSKIADPEQKVPLIATNLNMNLIKPIPVKPIPAK